MHAITISRRKLFRGMKGITKQYSAHRSGTVMVTAFEGEG